MVAAGVLGDRALAEDVLQEAAAVAWIKFDQFQDGTDFAAWMARIVRYTALNHGRARRRQRGLGLEMVADAPDRLVQWPTLGQPRDLTAGGGLSEWQAHFDDEVMTGLRELADVPRACLLLKIVEGLEYSEISRLMEIPEGTAMSHVHRSRIFLRKRLAGHPTARESHEGCPRTVD